MEDNSKYGTKPENNQRKDHTQSHLLAKITDGE